MAGQSGELTIELSGPDQADDEELWAYTQLLRRDLLALDVDDVTSVREAAGPDGAKDGGVLAVGMLVVRFVLRQDVLAHIIGGVRSWLHRTKSGAIKVTIDGDSIEVSDTTSSERERLIELWIARHATSR
jgi:hypothetical protein